MSDIKIFLTGGSGFIGKNILEILENKYKILAPSHNELDLENKEAVKEYLKRHAPNVILHAATSGGNRGMKDQSGVLQRNLTMFYNLCAGKVFFDRLIVFGSGAEYDKRREIHLVKEEFGDRVPFDEYGLSKFTISKLAENLDFVTHLRLFGVFGKYEDYSTRFISNAIGKKIFNLPITINKNVFFDYLYIKDMVKILEFFIEKQPKEKCYNVGTGKPIDLLSLAHIVNGLIGEKKEIEVLSEGLNNEYSCDTSRLKEFIGDYNFATYEEAIEEMFKYYESIKGGIDKNIFLKEI